MSKNTDLKNLRNIGIIAHIDAGKTTTTERLLFITGALGKIGEVHDGSATTDYMEQEKERGITITAAAVQVSWKNNTINIIDTPGHVDFTIEVQRSLRVLDGVVCLLDGVAGAQTQTFKVWKQASEKNTPRIVFINKLDREGADFFKATDTVATRLHGNPVIINVPIGQSGEFSGVIDLVSLKCYRWDDKDITPVVSDVIPAEYQETVNKYRQLMLETIIVEDDALMEKYMESFDGITETEIKHCLRLGTIRNNFSPVLGGSSYKNKGVQNLLDAVIDYLPSPIDVGSITGTDVHDENHKIQRKLTVDEHFTALAFKLINDPFVGHLIFVRVYSGVLHSGDKVFVPRLNKIVKIGRIVQMHSNKRKEIEFIQAGDIAAIVGGDFITGDTLTDEKHPILLESIKIPETVISMALEPKTKADQDKLSVAIQKLIKEDPSLSFSMNQETKQTIIGGMGELHLEIIVDRLKREFNTNVNIGDPIIAYKETITKEIDVQYLLKKQTGGAGQFAGISMRIKPGEEGSGIKFNDKVVGGRIPKEYIPSIEKGIRSAAQAGVLLGFPIIDFEVELYDGQTHDVDSSTLAFELCARMALRENIPKAGLILLEPIMSVVIEVPDEYLGAIEGDIHTKRGTMNNDNTGSSSADSKIISADVPLSEMTGYISKLREKTKGTGVFTMTFKKYQEVPTYIVNNLKEKL